MCGIFGIITPKPRKLDLRAFCVLGVNNDSRGGDSCGVFIDKKYEYGVNENKLFYNFFPKSKLLSSVTKCQVALGHCRKASVGAINAANAQPVVIKDDNGEVQYVLIHNGTIANYQELAAKYIPDINIKDMTDSQVMAQIFYRAGYDVLGEYIGAGAFVMVDYRSGQPEVFLFKGQAKLYHYSVTTTIAMPLFCTFSSTEFIFSSIADYLRPLRPGREVLTVTPNKLIELKDGCLYIRKEYDRTKLWQIKTTYYNKDYTYGSNNSSVSNIRKGSENSTFFQSGQNYWDDYVEMDENGVYRIGPEKAHGIYWADSMGVLSKEKRKNMMRVAFWKGVLLKNVQCFEFLSKFTSDIGCTPNETLSTFPDLVHFLSPCACWRTYKGQWVASDTPSTSSLYTGTAIFPFTTEETYFTNGRLTYYTEGITYKEALTDLKSSIDYKIDYDAIESSL